MQTSSSLVSLNDVLARSSLRAVGFGRPPALRNKVHIKRWYDCGIEVRMKVADIERKARRILQDTYRDAYRWNSDDIRDAVQEGVRALNAVRPETRYVDGRLVDVVEIGDGDVFPVDMRFEDAIVCFVVHKCYLSDSSDTANQQLSDFYLEKFNTKAQI